MNIEDLKNIVNEYKGKFNLNSKTPWQLDINFILFKEINNKYPKLFKNTMEVIYLIKNYDNLENLHIFCYCGNKNSFISSTSGYHCYCSNKCQINTNKWKENRINKNIEINFKYKQTCLKKYGVDNPRKNKNIIEKIKQTRKNNINEDGLNSYQQVAKIGKQTKLDDIDKNGLNSYQRQVIKSKQTCLKKYGVEYVLQDKSLREKIHQIRLNDIDENGLNSYQQVIIKSKNTAKNNIINGLNSYQRAVIKAKQTMLNDIDENGNNGYQRMNLTKLNNIDKNGLNSYQRASIKRNETMLNDIDENGLNSYQRVKIKIFETMKKNHTFNTSEGEEEIYKSLLTKFKQEDVLRQYKSKLYPFICDFYIKSLDLYIEYHGNWNHCPTKHRHPFKNSIEDLKVVEYLKKKSEEINFKGKKKDYYLNVIYVWTDLDVRKLEAFKKNKLNHCVFYNLDQFYNWFSKLK